MKPSTAISTPIGLVFNSFWAKASCSESFFCQQLLRGHIGTQAEDGIRFFILLAQGDERRLVVGGFPIRIGAGVGEHTGFAGLQDVPQHFFGKHA